MYAAFNRREIDAVLAKLHDNVDWPNGMEGGRILGTANVRDYWQHQWDVIDPHVEPLRTEDDELGHTVVDVHQVIRDRSGNVLLDQIVQHVYSIRDGLVERMEIRDVNANSADGSST